MLVLGINTSNQFRSRHSPLSGGIFLFSAPDFPLTVAVKGETILPPCYQAKTDAKQTKQKTPLVSSEP